MLAVEHPKAKPRDEYLLRERPMNFAHETMFDEITPDFVKKLQPQQRELVDSLKLTQTNGGECLDQYIYGDTGRLLFSLLPRLCW